MSSTILIVSGPSGAGKSLIVTKLVVLHPSLVLSTSYTTREPRGTEKDGIEYHFKARNDFLEMRAKNHFLESALYGKSWYGTSRRDTTRILDSGKSVVLEIDCVGADMVRLNAPCPTLSFFISSPLDVRRERILARNPDMDPAELERRLAYGEEEMKRKDEFDYVIVNDNDHTPMHAVQGVMAAITHRMSW